MRGHGTGFRGEGVRGNQYTAGNESTNLSSAVAQQLQGGESLQQLYYQQQGYPNNMVNGPNHFGVVGQQNPQQQVHSNNMRYSSQSSFPLSVSCNWNVNWYVNYDVAAGKYIL